MNEYELCVQTNASRRRCANSRYVGGIKNWANEIRCLFKWDVCTVRGVSIQYPNSSHPQQVMNGKIECEKNSSNSNCLLFFTVQLSHSLKYFKWLKLVVICSRKNTPLVIPSHSTIFHGKHVRCCFIDKIFSIFYHFGIECEKNETSYWIYKMYWYWFTLIPSDLQTIHLKRTWNEKKIEKMSIKNDPS